MRTRTKGGYKQRLNASVCEHTLIVERVLGKPLPKGAETHHVNENKLDNSHSNLVICQSRAYHKLLHVRMRVLKAGGYPNTQRICSKCRRLLLFSAFNARRGNISAGIQSACRECMNEYRRERKRSPRAVDREQGWGIPA